MIENEYQKIMEEFHDMPLRDVVFHTLRKSILRGYLKPDERLMEIKLAEGLGVSRTPIREAIRLLQLEGLVVYAPRKGTTVARITERELKEVLEVREGLESFCVQLAAERITEEQLIELQKAVVRFEELVKSDDVNDAEYLLELAKADEDIHMLVCRATGNTRMVQLMEKITDQIYRYRVEYLKDTGIRSQLIKEHNQLFEFLKEKDPNKAVGLISQHISQQRDYILRSVVEK